MNRGLCIRCLQPSLTCYCKLLQPFDPKIQFVILIHGREARRRIATGRLAHLCLQNSLLLQGYDYSDDKRVDAILENPSNFSVLLFPGADAKNLSQEEPVKLSVPKGKILTVFVIDGTWITARKTWQRSTNLQKIPKICFNPNRPSRFRVRKQPQANFFSTVEAIHETIELLGEEQGFPVSSREHDKLLQVFDHLVDQQIELAKTPKLFCYWRGPKKI